MVYVYAKLSHLNKYLDKEMKINEIEETLKDIGMDIKGISKDEDPELKIEITAERIDMVSVVGIARAINYYKGFRKELPKYNVKEPKYEVIVDSSVKEVRPKTVAAIIRNAPMDEEFLQEIIDIQEKIHASFGRHRKKAAIGIYPLKEISFPIMYKALEPEKIKFKPLESETEMNGYEILENHPTGKKYGHLLNGKNKFPIFIDSKGEILSMPPIINSEKTGRVTINDTDLFIECSGHNITYLDYVLKVLTTTFIDMGAEVEGVKVKYEDFTYILDLINVQDEVSLNYINSLIGINLDKKDIKNLLNRVMFNLIDIKDDKIKVEFPPFRTDIWNDCDIADEVARAYGYNNITPKFPNISSVGGYLKLTEIKEKIKDVMTNMGFIELYDYILTSTVDQFKKVNLDEKKFGYVKIINSADEGINMCRINIFPEILKSLNFNKKNKYPQKVFELGYVIIPKEDSETGAINQSNLSVAIADSRSNFTEIKGVLERISMLFEKEFQLKESNLPYLIPGRQAEILFNNEKIGFIGELHPEILRRFGFLVPISLFEINLDILFKKEKESKE